MAPGMPGPGPQGLMPGAPGLPGGPPNPYAPTSRVPLPGNPTMPPPPPGLGQLPPSVPVPPTPPAAESQPPIVPPATSGPMGMLPSPGGVQQTQYQAGSQPRRRPTLAELASQLSASTPKSDGGSK
jgi:hypothetical protein